MGTFFRQNAGLGKFVLVLAGSSLILFSTSHIFPSSQKVMGYAGVRLGNLFSPLKKKKKSLE